MNELIAYIAQSIVQHPDQVVVTEDLSEDNNTTTLHLTVHPDDMGSIIGKDGNIARALRSIAKALAIKQGQRVYIDIVETAQPEA